MIVAFVLLGISTALLVVWLWLLFQVRSEDWQVAALVKSLHLREQIEMLKRKEEQNKRRMEEYQGLARIAMGWFLPTNFQKKIASLEKQDKSIWAGKVSHVGLLAMPGHVLLRRFDSIGKSDLHKKTYAAVRELYGAEHAEYKTKQLLAGILSYPILAVALTFGLCALLMGVGNKNALVVLVVGTALACIAAYAMYDDIHSKATKRRETIARNIPAMLSKFALLVTSGMIVDQAWKQTAYSDVSPLYLEMQKTVREIEENIPRMDAYGNFIARCNTKETTKFASAIMQNMTKGNAEIGILIKMMAKESWFERKHSAKKNSEKANTRLMIPTLLLFAVVLFMIMVPVAMNFQGF